MFVLCETASATRYVLEQMPRVPEEHMRALQSVSRGQRWCVKGGVCEVCERCCVREVLCRTVQEQANNIKRKQAEEGSGVCERADVLMCPAKLRSYNSI